MKKIKLKYNGESPLGLIIIVWVLIFSMPLLSGEFDDGINWSHIIRIWKESVIVLVVFLINRFILLPKLLFKEKKAGYLIIVSGVILIMSSVVFLIDQRPDMGRDFIGERRNDVPPPFEGKESGAPGLQGYLFRNDSLTGPPPKISDEGKMMPPPPRRDRGGPPGLPGKFPIPPFSNVLIMSLLIVGFDTGLIVYNRWTKGEQKRLKVEKESVQNKMAFLQNQISPHFFMNTLNNIHSLIDISSEEAKEAVIKLSRMMGYMLYESKTEKVPLQKEMEFVYSYIELMKIRFTDEVKVELDIPKFLPPVGIPPLLTISFVENAFKHGISYSEPCFVRISFSFEKDRMIFGVINKIYERKAPDGNLGVGVENARKRLDLIYGKNYSLEIGAMTDDKLFAVNLNIPL